jgi:hypothetical protein
MRLVSRFLGAAAVAAALALSFAVPGYAAPAHAAAPVHAASIKVQGVLVVPASCPAGSACIYANAGFSGGPGRFSGTNPNWGADFTAPPANTCVPGSSAAADNHGGWNDCASSVADNTASAFVFYTNNNCTGAHFELPAGMQNTNIGQISAGFNDSLSSDSKGSAAVSC